MGIRRLTDVFLTFVLSGMITSGPVMSRITLFFFTCLAICAMALGQSVQRPEPVPGPDSQCKEIEDDAGNALYTGSCMDMGADGYMNPDICRSLKCRKRDDNLLKRTQIDTGIRARNGTICGKSKICRKGVCEEVDREQIPQNLGRKDRYFCRKLTNQPGMNEKSRKRYFGYTISGVADRK